jgi:hypothetical protein
MRGMHNLPKGGSAKAKPSHLAAAFQQAELDDIPLPRQAYGIDFFGHAKGEILVAIDLCTREALLWFLPNRRQENIARALLTGLIFQKGVPLIFRNDEAAELVAGTAISGRHEHLPRNTTSHDRRTQSPSAQMLL